MIDLKLYVETLESKPVAVFGLARSGLSCIKALIAADAKVIAYDDNERAREKAAALGANIQDLTPELPKECACLILAPGVPLTHPEPHAVVKAAQKAGIEIICDIELLHRAQHGLKTVGVTGTNGKSTTVALIHHILLKCGIPSALGGNIGQPVMDMTLPPKDGVIVLEISSYQLDLCPSFRPDIAVLLNITPDHLDRHGTMENYIAAKHKIFANTEKDEDQIKIKFPESDLSLLEGSKLLGEHNAQNAAAAYEVCREIGINDDAIRQAIQSFPGLAHRQYLVRQINGVLYVNDSKATNAEAAAKALGSYENIYWIAGGRAKEGGLNGLEDLMPRVKQAFLIGESEDDFAQWLEDKGIKAHKCSALEDAVIAADQEAQKEETATVLLSPACASFDQYASFEQRGDAFVKFVD